MSVGRAEVIEEAADAKQGFGTEMQVMTVEPTSAAERRRFTFTLLKRTNTLGAGKIRTRITKNGLHMAFVAVFAVLGGSVRGFNLLVILAGIMVGILLMQWRFSRAALPGLQVRRMLPSEVYAGLTFKVRFWLTNDRWWLPAWLIRFEDPIRDERLSSAGKITGVCCVAMVNPGATEASQYDCRISQRGKYRLGPLRMTTGFPFGLIRAVKNVGIETDVTVYPQLAKLVPNWVGMLENQKTGLSATRRSSGPNEGDFYGIRSWQTGDSKRWIHWRTTARLGQLAVRQFERRNQTQLSIVLDTFGDSSTDLKDFEWAISLVAAMVTDLSRHYVPRVAVAIASDKPEVLVSSSIQDFRRRTMDALAVATATPEPDLHGAFVSLLSAADPQWPVVVVSARKERFELLRGSSSRMRRPHDGTGARMDSNIPPGILSRLDMMWLDVRSEACMRIASRAEGVAWKN